MERTVLQRPEPTWVCIATINITVGYGEAAENLHTVAKEGMIKHLDIIICTEMRIGSGCHAQHSGGYMIVATESSLNCGGVVFFICERGSNETELGWSVEDPEVFETNVIAVTLVMGQLHHHLIGVYLSPSEISSNTWSSLQRACNEAKDPVWLIGDFNCNLHDMDNARLDATIGPNGVRSVEVQAFVSSMGVQSFGRTKLHHKRQGFWMWGMRQMVQGREEKLKSVCDYILGPRMDPIMLYRTRSVKWIQTDHRMVYVDLLIHRQEHLNYMQGRKTFPNNNDPETNIDRQYAELVALQPKVMHENCKRKPNWILERAWKMIALQQHLWGTSGPAA